MGSEAINYSSFNEAREQLSLKEIKESLTQSTRENIKELKDSISTEVIDALWSDEGIVIKGSKGKDQLGYIAALTGKGNKIVWTNQKEADNILAGDVIKIKIVDGVKIITKNGEDIGIATGFERTIDEAGGDEIITNNYMARYSHIKSVTPENNQENTDYLEKFSEQLSNKLTLFNSYASSVRNNPESGTNQLEEKKDELLNYINSIPSDKISLVSESIDNTKLYLARYYGDKLDISHESTQSVILSNQLAFDILGEIEGIDVPAIPTIIEAKSVIEIIESMGLSLSAKQQEALELLKDINGVK